MKEWAEADNQSKNLPKSERQALNEVRRRWSTYFFGFTQKFQFSCGNEAPSLLVLVSTPSFFPPPALPVCAANTGGTGRWREAEAGGDSSCQSGGHTQQQPPPGPGELPDCRTV